MIHHGDCLNVMAAMEPESVDAIVTDPPYGLEFMGKEWDKFATGRAAKYRKGGDFKGTGKGAKGRSQDKGDYSWFGSAAARPTYSYKPAKRCVKCGKQQWSGSPCKCPEPEWAIDNSVQQTYQAWTEAWAREALRVAKPSAYLLAFGGTRTVHRMTVALEDAGWIIRDMLVWAYASGFPKSKASLKPAWEPIVMARKPGPLRELAIDACRIGYMSDADREQAMVPQPVSGFASPVLDTPSGSNGETLDPKSGRWPANVILTATEWYTLRDDVDQSARDLICDYFEAQGVGVDDVPRVWQGVRDHAGMGEGRATEILLPEMQLEGVAPGEASGNEAPARVDPADEGRDDGALPRGELPGVEGRSVPRPARLHLSGGIDLDGPAEGTSRGDGPEALEGQAVHSGAPSGDGDDAGSPAGAVRGSASPQRDQGRQQTEQPVPQGSVEPHPRASDDRPRAGTAARTGHRTRSRERGVTVPLDLIPAPWLRYFRFSHDTGIFDGGVEGVVGGGETHSQDPATRANTRHASFFGAVAEMENPGGYGDSGTYSRFFLIPKADRADREPVLGGLEPKAYASGSAHKRCAKCGKQEVNVPGSECRCEEPEWVRPETARTRANVHPTVKPTELMRHLVRLVTPSGGLVLDPFLGSGTTGLACELEGFPWVGIEREAEYVAIAEARLNGTQRGLGLDVGAPVKKRVLPSDEKLAELQKTYKRGSSAEIYESYNADEEAV